MRSAYVSPAAFGVGSCDVSHPARQDTRLSVSILGRNHGWQLKPDTTPTLQERDSVRPRASLVLELEPVMVVVFVVTLQHLNVGIHDHEESTHVHLPVGATY